MRVAYHCKRDNKLVEHFCRQSRAMRMEGKLTILRKKIKDSEENEDGLQASIASKKCFDTSLRNNDNK